MLLARLWIAFSTKLSTLKTSHIIKMGGDLLRFTCKRQNIKINKQKKSSSINGTAIMIIFEFKIGDKAFFAMSKALIETLY